jgi:hypothetical protein
VTQPPDDHTQRFDPFRDDEDSTRAMPPVPPDAADDDTRYFPFGSSDATRPVPPYAEGGDDATRVFPADGTRRYPAPPDATAAMPPMSGGPARGAATPVPPGGHVYGGEGNVYGGDGGSRPPYDDYDDEPEPRDPRRTALIVGGIVLAVLLVIGLGVVAAKALVGSSPTDSTTAGPVTAPSVSDTPSEVPSESPSPSDEFTVSAPPPEGPGPRVLEVSAPARVQCPDTNTQSVQISWRVAGTDRVDVSMDGVEVQQYDPNDDPVSVPFPCDGQAHKYQLTAFSNDDRQSQPRQVTVRPESPQPSAPPLFPAPTPG